MENEPIDPVDLYAAAMLAAYSKMFDFMLGALQVALKNERKAGYTATGAQLEPPTAHVVRPALESFLQEHWSVAGEVEMSPGQEQEADAIYQQHLIELQERILEMTYPFEI
jgi:hypothetical protein